MKVLITGSEGYLARNLARNLFKKKIICYGIGRGNWRTKKQYKKWGYKKNLNVSINKKILNKFKNFNFDYVIHCAGGASPINSMINSVSKKQDFNKNVLSIKFVLDYILLNKKKTKIIFISSVSVYGNNNLKKITENAKIKPVSNYARNKFLAENLCYDYFKKYKINTLVLRGTTIFGPGLKKQFIYDACLKIIQNKRIFFGTGNEIRDYVYIDDFCNLINKVLNKSFKDFQIINAGTGKGTKLKDIIKHIKKKMGVKIIPKFNKFGFRTNPKSMVVNNQKAKKFNWYPKMKFYDGLDKYIKWFKSEYYND